MSGSGGRLSSPGPRRRAITYYAAGGADALPVARARVAGDPEAGYIRAALGRVRDLDIRDDVRLRERGEGVIGSEIVSAVATARYVRSAGDSTLLSKSPNEALRYPSYGR